MNKQRHFLFLIFLFIVDNSFSQGVLITPTKLEFDGKNLLISYDILDSNQSDQFYVWIIIEKKNGEPILAKALSGDLGEFVKSGINKQIIWNLEKDSIFLNEEVFVEIKAEEYAKSFNKASMVLLSTVIPGLGQTKVNNGKPWWLTGLVAYGALASGLIVHKNYLETYASYRIEDNPSIRADKYDQALKQMNISNTLIISSVAIWVSNILWVSLTPNKYKPLKHVQLSLKQSTSPYKSTTLLTLRLNF
jgi:hypothetical protein